MVNVYFLCYNHNGINGECIFFNVYLNALYTKIYQTFFKITNEDKR